MLSDNSRPNRQWAGKINNKIATSSCTRHTTSAQSNKAKTGAARREEATSRANGNLSNSKAKKGQKWSRAKVTAVRQRTMAKRQGRAAQVLVANYECKANWTGKHAAWTSS